MPRPLLWAGPPRRRRRRGWPRYLLLALLVGLALRQVGAGVAEVGGSPLPPVVTRAQVAYLAGRAGRLLQAGWAAARQAGAAGWARIGNRLDLWRSP